MLSPFQIDPEHQGWLELPNGQIGWLRERTTIGRHADNELVLPDETLSRQHALITRGPAGHMVEDLRSRNGTHLAGRPLTQPAPLRDGDRLRLGAVELRFRCLRRLVLPDPERNLGDTTQALSGLDMRDCWIAHVILENPAAALVPANGVEAPLPLQSWIAGVRSALEQPGRINRYMPDGILVTWAADTSKAADVLASLVALEAFRAESPLPFRVLLHHGMVMFSAGERGEELGGRDIAFVVRMKKIAEGFNARAMLSAAAARALGVENRCDSYGRAPVEGFADPVTFHGLPRGLHDSAGVTVEHRTLNAPVTASGQAVFLSYASQDGEAARQLCVALRSAGVEVWFDQNELRGGDAWDHKIRRQVKECALFVPLVSANTQARREGYFRIEWKLAAQRTHAIADGTPFLLPVLIDATPEPDALVPTEFRDVQWTRLNSAGALTQFAQRTRDLLQRELANAAPRETAVTRLPWQDPAAPAPSPAVPAAAASRKWVWLVAAAMVIAAVVAFLALRK